MPMLHISGLGCGSGLGSATTRDPSVPYTVGEVQGWTDQQAYGVVQAGAVSGTLWSDPAAVEALYQKAARYAGITEADLKANAPTTYTGTFLDALFGGKGILAGSFVGSVPMLVAVGIGLWLLVKGTKG